MGKRTIVREAIHGTAIKYRKKPDHLFDQASLLAVNVQFVPHSHRGCVADISNISTPYGGSVNG
ncbi:hypothetical protein [Paenibacillus sp. 453mf]|uniref:hypothetical protein n=1 Tax=Paenibacillus sp. 453mf TaxID=1761874 RepID=UPI0011146250|nr:hypothetical protein [Paenibacillus sp. 453mf]